MNKWTLIPLLILSVAALGAANVKTNSVTTTNTTAKPLKKLTVVTNKTTTATSPLVTAGPMLPSLNTTTTKTAIKTNQFLPGGVGPVITNSPLTVIAIQGSNTSFTVGAFATNAPKYQWSFNNSPIAGATNKTLNVTNVQSAGTYSVYVTNLYGGVSAQAYCSVRTTNILANCGGGNTNTVAVYWDYNFSINSALSGFNIYDGLTSHVYSVTNHLGLVTNAVVSNLSGNTTYFIMATARDTNNLESAPSPELSYTVPGGKTTSFNLSIVNLPNGDIRLQTKVCPSQVVIIQYATKLNNPQWSNLSTNTADQWGNVIYDDTNSPTRGPSRFYRGQTF